MTGPGTNRFCPTFPSWVWILFILSAAMIVLLINGLIVQERFRLWQRHQEELAERHRAQVAEQKRAAAEKIKEVLRQRRAGVGVDVAGQLNAALAEARGAARSGEPVAAGAEAPAGQPREPAPTAAPD